MSECYATVVCAGSERRISAGMRSEIHFDRMGRRAHNSQRGRSPECVRRNFAKLIVCVRRGVKVCEYSANDDGMCELCSHNARIAVSESTLAHRTYCTPRTRTRGGNSIAINRPENLTQTLRHTPSCLFIRTTRTRTQDSHVVCVWLGGTHMHR